MTILPLAAAVAWCACAGKHRPVVVATTAEIASAGLIQHLGQIFQKEGGPPIELHVVGLEDVFKLASTGSVSVAITDSSAEEMRFVGSGHARLYTKFAYDDFLIAGPANDPARVRSARSAADAFHRIASRRRPFCSATGVPDLHDREAVIWSAAGLDPASLARYSACAGTAEAVLRQADRHGAYTLSKRSVLDQMPKSIRLNALFTGDALLHDDLAAILVATKTRTSRDRDAEWFVEWLSSSRVRDEIENYRSPDGRRFFVHDPGEKR